MDEIEFVRILQVNRYWGINEPKSIAIKRILDFLITKNILPSNEYYDKLEVFGERCLRAF